MRRLRCSVGIGNAHQNTAADPSATPPSYAVLELIDGMLYQIKNGAILAALSFSSAAEPLLLAVREFPIQHRSDCLSRP